MTATPERAARHSRATAACMSSPFFGKYQGRIQLPTGSSSAWRARWLAWMAVVRTGPGRRLDAALVGETIGLPILGVVPHDGSLPQALESGTPPGLGGSRFAKACDRLLDGLLGDEVAGS